MMAMDTTPTTLVPSGIPRALGDFRLDDHNVVEWSESERHRGRKETGKWVNPFSNADIKYRKEEDSLESSGGREQRRTEVIQGQAPDSQFQILRSQTHTTGGDGFSQRMQSTSTSFQSSSAKGMRSTSKSTSNRTTTKTLTVSGGGGRSEDFELLGLPFHPLDTSRQRERINVSRSGTMGVRRPPTRRHTPAPIISPSPDLSELENKEDQLLVDSDDNLREQSPEMEGRKGLTPKFRGVMVGFPIEIQLELQSRFGRQRGEAVEIGETNSLDFHVEQKGSWKRESLDLDPFHSIPIIESPSPTMEKEKVEERKLPSWAYLKPLAKSIETEIPIQIQSTPVNLYSEDSDSEPLLSAREREVEEKQEETNYRFERSRKLLQMLEKTPRVFRDRATSPDWGQGQRQLNFLNDSLSRILEGGNSTSRETELKVDVEQPDINGNLFKPQISQTWISLGDFSKKVRDNEVTTSIATTNDLRKKVEFCKTEVHFTPDSGKFHIIESESKPSPTTIFRRRKRERNGSKKTEVEEEQTQGNDWKREELEENERMSGPSSLLLETCKEFQTSLSQTVPEFQEMKIQQYLSQLKGPGSRSAEPSSSYRQEKRMEGPSFQLGLGDRKTPSRSSFVPLATRRSLIEMNSSGRHNNQDRDRVSPVRLARMEATVATGPRNPQITSVELRYEFDKDLEEENRLEDNFNFNPHTFSYSSRADRISNLIQRSMNRRDPGPLTNQVPLSSLKIRTEENRPSSPPNLFMSVSSPGTVCSGSKSIVTIGDYRPKAITPEPSPEPLLSSLDHVFKGPASLGALRPASAQETPEWVLKARNRERRERDWESVGRKEQAEKNETDHQQPPWITDLLRGRNNKTPVPKVSVVYPWQREEQEEGLRSSHILSIIPTASGPEADKGKKEKAERVQPKPKPPPKKKEEEAPKVQGQKEKAEGTTRSKSSQSSQKEEGTKRSVRGSGKGSPAEKPPTPVHRHPLVKVSKLPVKVNRPLVSVTPAKGLKKGTRLYGNPPPPPSETRRTGMVNGVGTGAISVGGAGGTKQGTTRKSKH